MINQIMYISSIEAGLCKPTNPNFEVSCLETELCDKCEWSNSVRTFFKIWQNFEVVLCGPAFTTGCPCDI